ESGFVPLVDGWQEVGSKTVAVQIVGVVSRIAGLPEFEGPTAVELIRSLASAAGVEPVDKSSRVEPRNICYWLIETAIAFRNPKRPGGVCLIDHLFGNFVLANPITIGHRPRPNR